jgi:hypothetical protein
VASISIWRAWRCRGGDGYHAAVLASTTGNSYVAGATRDGSVVGVGGCETAAASALSRLLVASRSWLAGRTAIALDDAASAKRLEFVDQPERGMSFILLRFVLV